MRVDPNLLIVFLAVAERGSLSAAASHLDVTRSAVSQSLRRLEDRLGTALVVRTTRSARLTETGVRLRDRLSGPFFEINESLDTILGDATPTGFLRLAVASIAERILSGPLIASFAEAYPGIMIDVTVTDAVIDIVEHGFDAGVRLGEVVEQDMIAVPVGGEIREMAVAAPGFLAKYGCPEHPRDLTRFPCIGWRPSPDAAPYRWEFYEKGQIFSVQVDPQITTNDPRFMLRSALAGAGITFTTEETFQPYVDRGELVSILGDYLKPFPGFFLYFPARRHMAPKLRAFVDHVRVHADDISMSNVV
ncbi:LysR family transcriptional regulator [Sphingomonas sp. PP-CC-3G-468]|uniref:LysR family transcriptional regulator n=1 Tax=Sphingomonas sp. PP-CC-3G-468 TaxID=2135656 RepID=UPI0010439FBD|nr:LysR family transcriptional regulator [Sphingomonas sp. PP-CC-3G-468]TCM00436.1 LysR family transcriptional regulator [Sphingomonas sp. PP-CC-3G-468]